MSSRLLVRRNESGVADLLHDLLGRDSEVFGCAVRGYQLRQRKGTIVGREPFKALGEGWLEGGESGGDESGESRSRVRKYSRDR